MIMTKKKLNDFSIRSTYSRCCGFSLERRDRYLFHFVEVIDETVYFGFKVDHENCPAVSSEGKFSLSNVHPCRLHLSDGFQHVIVRFAGHFGNL